MTKLLIQTLLPAALACASAAAFSQTPPPPPTSRGQLLYTTHCHECHTTQMHWREDRRALDWDSLKAQVRRWQGNTGLGWSDADIAEVARHLNDTIYHYPPQTSDRPSLARRTGLFLPVARGRIEFCDSVPLAFDSVQTSRIVRGYDSR